MNARRSSHPATYVAGLLVFLFGAGGAYAAAPKAAPTAGVGEVLVRAQAGETLKQLAIRTLVDTGDLTAVVRRNRLRTATTPLAAGTGIILPIERMIAQPLTARAATAGPGTQVRSSSGSLRLLKPDDAVAETESILAPAGASSLLVLPDGSRVQVAPNSEVQLQRLRKVVTTEIYQIEMNVVAGTAEANVEKQQSAGSIFNLRTRRAVTGIRGTELRVSDLGAADSTEVLSGSVAVAGASGQAVTVPAGKGTVVDTTGKPATPVALLPAPDLNASKSLYDRITMDVAFAGLPGASRYRARVLADTPGGAQVVAEQVGREPNLSFNAPPDGNYRLTVRGIDGSGLEGFEAARAITIKARPVPPVAMAPRPAEMLFAPDVSFRWSEPEGVSAYQVELQDASGKKIVSAEDQRSPQFAAASLPPGEYRWRLASIAALASGAKDLGPKSDWFTFSIEPAPALGAKPTANNGISLNWTGKADANYVLELASDAQFSRVLRTQQVAGLSTELTGIDPGIYFMRVRRADPGAAFGPSQRLSLLKVWQTGSGAELQSSDGTPVDQR
ncbi:MAG: FecR domain-containing protein [Burkholderiaceae bacterium]